jgi:hypothetical protein
MSDSAPDLLVSTSAGPPEATVTGPPEDTTSFSSPEETHDIVMALTQSVGALQMDKVFLLAQIGGLQAQIDALEALLSLNTPATAPAAATAAAPVAVAVTVAAAAPAAVAALVLHPVCRVNELTQQGQLDDFTESNTHSGPDNERLHICSWTNVVTGQVISASAGSVKQARKDCAQLYLDHFA